MNKITKVIIWVIVVLIIVAGVWYGMNKQVKEERVIKIGVLGSLTGSYSPYGEAGIKAIEMAVNEINSSGGIDNKKIKLIVEDTQNDAKMAVSGAQKLINIDKVAAILSDSSTMTLTVAPIVEENKIPLIGYISTSPAVSEAGDYTFRTSPSNIEGMVKLSDFAFKTLGCRKIGVITELKDYSQGIREVFVEEFLKSNGTIVADEEFESGITDVKTQLLKIKSFNPDAILILTQSPGTGARVLKQIRELNLNLLILGNEVITSAETIKLVGEAAEGAISAEPDFDVSKRIAAELIEKYKQRGYPEPPQWTYVASAYDAAYIIAEAIDKVGINGEKIKDYLYTIKDREGAMGKLTFDKNGDPELSYSIKTIKDGQFVPYEE